MARQLRVEFQGAIYHVNCRMIGDSRLELSRLFGDDAERKRFLERLGERVEQYNVRLYLFVLMTNHFHLVFETPEGNCSRFMQSLLTAYTVYYNLRHERHGHLLDGRYKAKVVEGEEYLLALTRYVHLNPVMTGPMKERQIQERITSLRKYRWSTYPSYIGSQPRYDFVTYEPVLAEMVGKQKRWPERYREFVESGLAETDKDFEAALKASPRSIGGEGFRIWVDDLYDKLATGDKAVEDIAFRHVTEPLDALVVLNVLAGVLKVEVHEFLCRRRDSVLRAIAARYLMRYAGQSQRDVARLLSAGSGSAISKQLMRYRDMFEEESMAKTLSGIESLLDKERQKRKENATKS